MKAITNVKIVFKAVKLVPKLGTLLQCCVILAMKIILSIAQIAIRNMIVKRRLFINLKVQQKLLVVKNY